MAAGRGAPMPQSITHADVFAKTNADRADLIDRLHRGRLILSAVKGHLEANKIVAARSLTRRFDPSEQDLLDRVNAFLKEGLFGSDA